MIDGRPAAPREEPPLPDLPPIATPRLDLRTLILTEAEAFRTMTDEPGITEIVHFLPTPFTLADAERLIAGEGDGRDAFWGIRPRGTAALVGTVGSHLVGADGIEIGYWLATPHRRRGYASEAVAAVTDALAAVYPWRRIFAECRPENAASWRLLLDLGFTPDGRAGQRIGRMRLVLRR